jgi:hypothetical protein
MNYYYTNTYNHQGKQELFGQHDELKSVAVNKVEGTPVRVAEVAADFANAESISAGVTPTVVTTATNDPLSNPY